MANERVVFAHELKPDQSFRIVVAGEVDAAMVEALKAFAEFQGKLVGKTAAPTKQGAGDETCNPATVSPAGEVEAMCKQLARAAQEIRDEGHDGWGNTCEDAAAMLRSLDARLTSALAAPHEVPAPPAMLPPSPQLP